MATWQEINAYDIRRGIDSNAVHPANHWTNIGYLVQEHALNLITARGVVSLFTLRYLASQVASRSSCIQKRRSNRTVFTVDLKEREEDSIFTQGEII
jgi:hypothetical protein